MNKTTIALQRETAEFLKKIGCKAESYDSIILRLIANFKGVETIGRRNNTSKERKSD